MSPTISTAALASYDARTPLKIKIITVLTHRKLSHTGRGPITVT